MKKKFKLGIIGAGNMASAIVGGILNNEILDANSIIISDLDDEKLKLFALKGVNTTKDNIELVKNCEYLLFAIKPQVALNIIDNLKDSIEAENIISIMAGISIAKIKSYLGKRNYARIMPNTPALVGKGMSAIAFSENFRSEFIISIFNSLGKTIEISEDKFDAVTSLSGSGPAYVYLFIKALIDGGLEGGLDFETSKTLALQTINGASLMIENSSKEIDTLITAVCSKGGTTIQAIESYKNDNLEEIIKSGMKKCRDRSIELGKE